MFYYKWKKYINDNIEIVPLELKGRGKRIDQKFSLSMKAVVDDLYQELISYLDAESDKPYALFGHSMGSTIVFELAHKLQEELVWCWPMVPFLLSPAERGISAGI